MKLKQGLYLLHRWMGIGMCLLLLMWFVSGVVLMYVHFPTLKLEERLQGLPPLDPEGIVKGPNALLTEFSIESLTLTSVLGKPAWLAKTTSGGRVGAYADSGERFSLFSASAAATAATQFMESRAAASSNIGEIDLIELDQWTVSGSLNQYRPLYKLPFNDDAGTTLYVSALTGQIVRDTVRAERAWNWLGANLHWIYPVALRRHAEAWNWVVVVLSSLGLVSIVTGAVIGVIRLRPRRPYRGRDWTPYRGMMKWHHVLGLVGSLFLFTFMLSGLLSMNPFGVFDSRLDYSALSSHYRGDAPTRIEVDDLEYVRQGLRATKGVKEIRWHWQQNQSHLILVRGAYDYQLLAPAGLPDVNGLERDIAEAATRAVRSVDRDARLLDLERLDAFDSYYYSHAGRWRPLPVYRLRFDDMDRSWLHVDGRTGELLSHVTSQDRAARWWYHGLHSLDFQVLINNRPLWDVVMIALSVVGLLLAVTSIVVGWRRLRRRRPRRSTVPGSEAGLATS